MRPLAAALATSLPLTALLSAPRALAAETDEQAACITAYEAGQRQRNARDLLQARDQLLRCALKSCPALVQGDCADWSREVEKQIPTIIVSARFADGRDVTAAEVWLDDQVVAKRLDGRPIPLNPGEHRVQLRVGDEREEQIVVANQGEKDRPLRFVISIPARSAAPEPPATPAAEGRRSVVPYVLGGVSLLAAAGFAYFSLTARRDLNELRDSCAPQCSQGSLDDVKRRFLIGDLLLGVSVASAGTALVWYAVDTPATNSERSGRGLFLSLGSRF